MILQHACSSTCRYFLKPPDMVFWLSSFFLSSGDKSESIRRFLFIDEDPVCTSAVDKMGTLVKMLLNKQAYLGLRTKCKYMLEIKPEVKFSLVFLPPTVNWVKGCADILHTSPSCLKYSLFLLHPLLASHKKLAWAALLFSGFWFDVAEDASPSSTMKNAPQMSRAPHVNFAFLEHSNLRLLTSNCGMVI